MDDPTVVIAIDPGTTKSGFALINIDDYRILASGKIDNERMLDYLYEMGDCGDPCVIEMVGSYGGIRVGASTFETCIWIGRFIEINRMCNDRYNLSDDDTIPDLVMRATVKTHFTGKANLKDKDVIAALVDRFAPGQPNYGKGTKAEPGWFYGMKADAWQAYALGVYWIDKYKEAQDG